MINIKLKILRIRSRESKTQFAITLDILFCAGFIKFVLRSVIKDLKGINKSIFISLYVFIYYLKKHKRISNIKFKI